MPTPDSVVVGDTLDLSDFDLGDGPVFVDLDINTAGALTPNNAPSQNGVVQIGDEEIALNDVENIIGSDLDERLFGSEEDGFILAGGGDDTVHPFNGDDVVDGGLGVDTLLLNAIDGALVIDLKRGFANTADQKNAISNFENVTGSNLFSDRILGDRFDNVLSGGASGDDTLKGRNGDDQLFGEAGADRLHGGRGDDVLDGGADADRLIGAKGDDTLTGGEDADRFIFRGRWNDDVITDLNFAEGDTVKISGRRLIKSEADLISYAERLNEDNKQQTSASIEGDDLLLKIKTSELLIEGAADWAADFVFA
ncbi:MAG: calcium-binding protein [Pseudomonadota bacterium]